MAVLKLNAAQFALYHRKLAKEFRPTIMRGVMSGAQRSIAYLVDRTRKAPPANPAGIGEGGAVNTGAFIKSWTVRPLPDGAALMNTRGYSPIVEHGRQAGSRLPPKRAIVPWLIRRLKLKPEQAEKIWYPVALSIARRGLIGRKIISADEARSEIMKRVNAEVLHELQRAIAKRPQ